MASINIPICEIIFLCLPQNNCSCYFPANTLS